MACLDTEKVALRNFLNGLQFDRCVGAAIPQTSLAAGSQWNVFRRGTSNGDQNFKKMYQNISSCLSILSVPHSVTQFRDRVDGELLDQRCRHEQDIFSRSASGIVNTKAMRRYYSQDEQATLAPRN